MENPFIPVGGEALDGQMASAVALLFTSPDCGVCHALRPRLESMLGAFPQMMPVMVDVAQEPELAREWQVSALPTLVLLFEGRETVRFCRSFGVAPVREAIERPYALLFD